MALQIASLRSPDLDACASLFIAAFNAPPWNDGWTRDTAGRRLRDILESPGALGLLASEREAVGFLLGNVEQWHTGEVFHLREMAVHPGHRRRGIGTSLFERLEVDLRSRAIRSIYLMTAKGEGAEQFYTRAGFRASHRQVVMSRRL
jgi:aminoglycoside 6'-N-acetyltransferase I